MLEQLFLYKQLGVNRYSGAYSHNAPDVWEEGKESWPCALVRGCRAWGTCVGGLSPACLVQSQHCLQRNGEEERAAQEQLWIKAGGGTTLCRKIFLGLTESAVEL